jgi:hypothetical protein
VPFIEYKSKFCFFSSAAYCSFFYDLAVKLFFLICSQSKKEKNYNKAFVIVEEDQNSIKNFFNKMSDVYYSAIEAE